VTATPDGFIPTGTVAITEAVAVSITDTVLSLAIRHIPSGLRERRPPPKPANNNASINTRIAGPRTSFNIFWVNFVIVYFSLFMVRLMTSTDCRVARGLR
jgi:hypothetical protein